MPVAASPDDAPPSAAVELLARKPRFKFRRRPKAENLAHIERVVEAGALVVQHHIVRARHAHDVIHARGAQQRQQRVHVVLIGLRVIGVTHIAAHGQAQQLAAKMILQSGADNLLAVVQILRTDEAHDGIHQHRIETPRHRIGAGLQRLLIHAVMRVGRERRALAGFEVHHVAADSPISAQRPAVQRLARIVRFREKRQGSHQSCDSPLRSRRSTGRSDPPVRLP